MLARTGAPPPRIRRGALGPSRQVRAEVERQQALHGVNTPYFDAALIGLGRLGASALKWAILHAQPISMPLRWTVELRPHEACVTAMRLRAARPPLARRGRRPLTLWIRDSTRRDLATQRQLRGWLDYDREKLPFLTLPERIAYFEWRVRRVAVNPLERILATEIEPTADGATHHQALGGFDAAPFVPFRRNIKYPHDDG